MGAYYTLGKIEVELFSYKKVTSNKVDCKYPFNIIKLVWLEWEYLIGKEGFYGKYYGLFGLARRFDVCTVSF